MKSSVEQSVNFTNVTFSSKWDKSHGKLFIILLYLSAFILLWLPYKSYMVQEWGYYGFYWKPNLLKIIEGLLIVIICATILPSRIKKPSDILVHIQLLFPVLPMLVLFGAEDLPRLYVYFTILSLMLINYSRHCFFINVKFNGLIKKNVLMYTCLIISFMVLLTIIILGGLSYLNFNPLKVYDFRRVASSNLPAIYGFITPNITKVLLPFSLVLAVAGKNIIAAFLSILGSILMYGMLHHKGIIFYPIIVLCVYYIITKSDRFLLTIIASSNLILFISWIDTLIGGVTYIATIILRRMYFVPASANFGYYDFFSKNKFVMLSNSKITMGLIDYPYKEPYQSLLGKLGGFDEMWANTGWIGTSYMHFGYWGMLLFALFIGLLFNCIDSLAKSRGNALVTGLVLIPFFSLFISSDLPTALLTHGILLTIFLLYSLRLR